MNNTNGHQDDLDFTADKSTLHTYDPEVELEVLRSVIAHEVSNDRREELGLLRNDRGNVVTHESHVTRGLVILPTVHLSGKAFQMELKGIKTTNGNRNRAINIFNRKYTALVLLAEKVKMEMEAVITESREAHDKIDEAVAEWAAKNPSKVKKKKWFPSQ